MSRAISVRVPHAPFPRLGQKSISSDRPNTVFRTRSSNPSPFMSASSTFPLGVPSAFANCTSSAHVMPPVSGSPKRYIPRSSQRSPRLSQYKKPPGVVRIQSIRLSPSRSSDRTSASPNPNAGGGPPKSRSPPQAARPPPSASAANALGYHVKNPDPAPPFCTKSTRLSPSMSRSCTPSWSSVTPVGHAANGSASANAPRPRFHHTSWPPVSGSVRKKSGNASPSMSASAMSGLPKEYGGPPAHRPKPPAPGANGSYPNLNGGSHDASAPARPSYCVTRLSSENASGTPVPTSTPSPSPYPSAYRRMIRPWLDTRISRHRRPVVSANPPRCDVNASSLASHSKATSCRASLPAAPQRIREG